MLTRQEIERQGVSLWCVGLPLAEERRLDREEQEHLRRAAWRLLWQGLGTFLGLLVFGGLLMALTSVVGGAWSGSLVIIVLIFAALLLFLPASLFAREGRTQKGLLLFRDLHRGYVRVFSGPLTDADLLQSEDAADAAQSRLLALGLLTLDGLQRQAVEVLPVSRRVWRVSGERVAPWVEARWKEVAVSVEATSPWLHPNRPVADDDEASRRRLSHRERAELLREARQHWFRPFVPALLLTSWFAVIVVLGLTALFATGRITWSPNLWGVFHLAWITFAADAFFFQRWALARKMYRDARGGEVLVSFQSRDDGSNSATVFESLPYSERPWTETGRPAAWRRIGR